MQKESKNERIYVYAELTHLSVHLKLIQHCKSAILQQKKFFFNVSTRWSRVLLSGYSTISAREATERFNHFWRQLLSEAVLEWISVDLSLWKVKYSLQWVKSLQVLITKVSIYLYNEFLLLRGICVDYPVSFLIYYPEAKRSSQAESGKYSSFY